MNFEDYLTGRVKAAAKGLVIEETESDDSTEEIETHGTEETGSTKGQEVKGNVTRANLFKHPNAHPLVLDLCLLKAYGPDFMLWEPETLQLRIEKEQSGISAINMQKIQACKTLHLAESFWTRWEVFGWVCEALNGSFADFDTIQTPTVAEMLRAVDIANRIRDDVKWSDDVKETVIQLHRFDGLLFPIPPLDFIKIDVSDFSVDASAVWSEWQKIVVGKAPPTQETVEAEQLRRMYHVGKALDGARSLLKEQLPLIQNDAPHYIAR